MMGHPNPARLSALLDGDVPAAEARELEVHLRSCRECSTLFTDLRKIRETARTLPEHRPPRDLWPEIAKEIERGTERDPQVIRLHVQHPPIRTGWRRTLQLSLPQAAAAGVVIALLSGAVGAGLRSGGGGGGTMQVADSPFQAVPSWVSLVKETQPGLEARALEVAALEESLFQNRGILDPVTVDVLERNLMAMDVAIRESVEAIRSDPGNRFLKDNLERAIMARGEFLQDTAPLVVPAT